MTFTLNYSACSDKGLVRSNNEDSAYAGPRLLALADGMGGHAAGEIASQFLVNALSPLDTPLIDDAAQRERLVTLLATATDEGNQAIAAHVDEHPILEGMGCTLTAMLFRGSEVGVCHIGDSRGYLLRNGELTQITKDDTFVQSLVDEGKLDPADVSSHPQRSLILKALTGRPVESTLFTQSVQEGDRFLLCSDGLSDPVSYDTIREVLSTGTPAKAARKLVEMALRGGGPDNVTVVVADVVSEDSDVQLPSGPVLAGAVGNQAEEFPRPNSSAARAAAIKGLSTTTRASHPSPSGDAPAAAITSEQTRADGEGAEAGGGVAQKNKLKRKRVWITLSIMVVALLAAGIGGVVVYNQLKDTYYLAEHDGQIVMENGAEGSILGVSLHSTFKKACLDRSGTLTLVDPDAANTSEGGDCVAFGTSDLNPAARGAFEDLPDGDYAAVKRQLDRLAEQALPACVTRVPADGSEPSQHGASGDAGSAGETGNAEENAEGSDSPHPSASSTAPANPEDLTTPGISCREVE